MEASVDSVQKRQDSIFAFLHVGKKYSIKSPLVSSKRKKKKEVAATVYDADITKEQLVKNLENNGYPFAKVKMDSVELTDSSLSFKYTIDKGKFITIDSFINHGSSKLTKGFVQNYVLIKRKQAYNESRIQNIDNLFAKITLRNHSSAKYYCFQR